MCINLCKLFKLFCDDMVQNLCKINSELWKTILVKVKILYNELIDFVLCLIIMQKNTFQISRN